MEVKVGCSLVAVLKPATSKGAPLTTTLTCSVRTRVVDKSDHRMCGHVSLKANGSLTSCAMGKRLIPCRLVSVMRPKAGCGIFRFRHSFLGTCRNVRRHNGVPVLYKNAKVCIRSMLQKCGLGPIPRGTRLHTSLSKGSLRRLASLLTACGILRGAASMSARGHTVHTVRVRRCCHGRPITPHNFPRVHSLIVKISVSERRQEGGVDHELRRHLSSKVISRVEKLLTRNVSTRRLVCCNLRCGCLARCIVNRLACRRVFHNLRVTVRRFTGHRVA